MSLEELRNILSRREAAEMQQRKEVLEVKVT
jgi:hypothetical protein